MQNISLDLK
jgi:hypothetical protein